MSDQMEPEGSESLEHERDRSWSRLATYVVPALVLVGLLAWGFLRPGAPPQQQAPDFELQLLGGGTLSSDELKGDPVVLNFWASWCIPCREEMPAFERMWDRYRDDGIRIIGVNLQDSAAGAQEFVDEIGVSYPIALDTDGSLASELGVRGLPQTFFIDEDFRFEKISAGEAVEGRGDRVVFGAIDEDTLEEKIRELLRR
ncbi:MAG: TlpA family protein disulfide reductase [Actinobacteria bacterium]|nr:TlpA family protein disulfide reductase [Actinomycetota bacterium]